MNIYHYNKELNLYHQEEDCGSITSPPDEHLDCGNIDSEEVIEKIPLENKNLFYSKIETHTNYTFTFRGGSESKKVSINFKEYIDLNTKEIIFSGIVLKWIGFGTVFEFDNGTERIVSPYLSKGTVR